MGTTGPITLVFGETRADCRSVLGPGADAPWIHAMTWEDLEHGAPEGLSVEAVLYQSSPAKSFRRGLIEILRRAYPDAVFFSFGSGEQDADPAGRSGGGLERHIVVPLAAANLRGLIDREGRLRSVSRRYQEALVRVREQSEKLDLLVESAKAANSLLEPARVMQVIMDRTQEFLAAEGWSVYLLVEEDQKAWFEVTRGGLGQDLTTMRQAADCGIAGWVVRHRRPAMIDDVGLDPRWAEEPERLPGAGAHALLAIPLSSRGRVIGAVEMRNKVGGGAFEEKDLETLRTMMEPAATTIENAILFKRLEELSVTDDLTKLHNSRYLNQYLQQEMKRSKRYGHSVSLLFLDLDGFKTVNDRFGHLAGSRTLTEVGRVIRLTTRETDVVSRYGGDEFTVVLPQTGIEGAMVIARRLREALAEHVYLESMGLSVRITASIGIACYPGHGETREDLIGNADRAMYRVKDRGKNGVELACQELCA